MKRQLDDPDDQEAGEDKKARIESDPHLRHHQQSRGQRRKRSETPEDPESVEGDGKTVKKSRQEEDSISEAEGMDMDDTFADYSSKKYQQSDDMDLEVGDQIDDDSSVRIMQSRVDGLSERPKRPRSVSVETTLSSTQDRPARKTTRRVSRQPSLSTLKSSPSMSLSPDLRAKLAKKSHKPRPGETWKDPSGAKLRINAQGVKEQLVKVKERRPKYNMVGS